MNYENQYAEYKRVAEEYIKSFADGLCGQKTLIDAIRYALLGGGKRIRFVLALAAADFFGVKRDEIMPFALAIELIHTYSLVHDDLPALDNDDLRRGKPTCHVAYGEDYAVLAGDGLLNLAYETLFSACDSPLKVKAAARVAKFAGVSGMIGGQAYDLASQAKTGEEYLYKIQLGKTCALISAPLAVAQILSGGDGKLAERTGERLGLIFQFGDDVLDVEGSTLELGKTIGKDGQTDKLTAVSVYGLDGAKSKMAELYGKIEEDLKNKDGSQFLLSLAKGLLTRRS